MSARTLTALAATAALAPAAAAHAAPGDTTLVSHLAGTPATHQVYGPTLSGDGSTVVFGSSAPNLSAIDQDGTLDVFAHTIATGSLALVSAKPPPVAGPDIAGDLDSTSATVSANGRYVAFRSPSINLHDDDQDNTDDIYRRDLLTGEIELVSRATGAAGAAADDDSNLPSISGDGRFVAFQSDATNLSPADEDAYTDIFVRDLDTDVTYLASRIGGIGADGDSGRPKMSADGSTVVYTSDAFNLSPVDMHTKTDVYAHTLATGATELVSRETAADGGAGQSDDAGTSEAVAVSADGRHVAFTTNAANLTPSHGPALDIIVRDRVADTNTLVSRADGPAGAIGDGAAFQPSISADGTKVAFHTYATNMHPEDTDFAGDVYVRDVAAQTTTLASRQSLALGGAKGDDASFAASISGDGTKVAFTSYADNYADVAGFANGQAYVHELGGQPAATSDGGAPSGGGTVPGAPGAPGAPSGTAPAGAPAAKRPAARATTRLAFRPGSSRCIRRGRLVLRLKVHRGERGARVIRANVRVGTRKTARLKGAKARRVVIRNLRGRKVTVRITARSSSGKVLTRTRTYRRCAAR